LSFLRPFVERLRRRRPFGVATARSTRLCSVRNARFTLPVAAAVPFDVNLSIWRFKLRFCLIKSEIAVFRWLTGASPSSLRRRCPVVVASGIFYTTPWFNFEQLGRPYRAVPIENVAYSGLDGHDRYGLRSNGLANRRESGKTVATADSLKLLRRTGVSNEQSHVWEAANNGEGAGVGWRSLTFQFKSRTSALKVRSRLAFARCREAAARHILI